MATWRYIKGSDKDFQGAPEWAMRRVEVRGNHFFLPERTEVGKPFYDISLAQESVITVFPDCEVVIAQRERVTSVNDDRLARDFGVDQLIAERGVTYLVRAGSVAHDNAVMFGYQLKPLYEGE